MTGPLETAYKRYRLELHRFFLRRSRDPQAAEDLIQNLYVSLKKTRPRSEVRDPRQYLFGMAWNLLHSENRRIEAERARAIACHFNDFDAHAERSNPLWVEDDAPSDQQSAELDRVLGQLPVACRVAVLRQYRDNRSYVEIARELGVTKHTVKKYIVRALNHFRMHLNSIDVGAYQEGKRR